MKHIFSQGAAVPDAHRSSAVYPPDGASVPAARAFVRSTLTGWSVPAERAEDAVLLAGELMDGAVRHSGTEIELTCALDRPGGLVRVQVRDLPPRAEPGSPARGGPGEAWAERPGGPSLTRALAERWGVTYSAADRTVWFELGAERPAAPADVPPPHAPAAPLLPAGAPPLGRLADHVVQWLRVGAHADVACVLAGGRGGARVLAAATAGGAAFDAAGIEPLAGAWLEHAGLVAAPPGGPYRSVAAIPLRDEGRRLGLLVVAAVAERRFDESALTRLRYAAEALTPVLARENDQVTRRGYRDWLGFLNEAGEMLAGTLDEELVLALAGQLYVPRVAEWCALYLEDAAGGARLAHVWHADEQRIAGLRRLLEDAPPPLPHHVREPRPWPGLAGLDGPGRRLAGPCVLELPLFGRDAPLGAVLLGCPDESGLPGELVGLAADLGTRVAQALRNARRYGAQASTSRILQRSLLPSQLPQVPGVDYDIVYLPAGEDAAAGGDFYDVFAAGADRWRFMLGDVCGTGPEAAAVTGVVRHTLRALSREGHDPARALDRLNDMLVDDAERLLTMLHGELCPAADGGARLTLAVAGHPLPLLLRGGLVAPLGTSQMLLGALPSSGYRLDLADLRSGDVLLCVTDGVTERRDGDRLLDDAGGLADILAACPATGPDAVTRHVCDRVRAFGGGPLTDDMAILALHVH
ncbi:ATP-binding SpoIIE family protein phosphatase [Actinomadura parmotrematis]|uniref:SpoIIE family protein phosphatase n=1 Tax=Actinomadura parmotrematis TaxID=2864039 RepID=A0ABS7G267_9ACTN|nr:SpoIIE family protein phosphatase [Actinomadura parmotrematis]MBW8486798.1 SpoIIE family protein phosphatase [Actinomadura parmotrematis]